MKRILLKALCVCGFLIFHAVEAKVGVIVENEYEMQAPQEIVDIAERAAQLMNFEQEYLMYAAKERTFYINPWAKFIVLGIHPTTKQPFISVNSEWFVLLPEQEQIFLMARCFSFLVHGTDSKAVKVLDGVPYAVAAMTFPIYWAINQTRYADYHWGVKIVAALVIDEAIDFLVSKPYQSLYRYVQAQHSLMVHNDVIAHTGDKEAAISALISFDAAIKKEVATGDLYWKPYEMTFAEYASMLEA